MTRTSGISMNEATFFYYYYNQGKSLFRTNCHTATKGTAEKPQQSTTIS